MLSLSPAKLLVVLVVALIVLGPEKLPQVARQFGAMWGDVRRWRSRVESEVRSTFPDLPPAHEVAQAVRSPLAFLDRLADEHERSTAANETVPDASQTAPDASQTAPDAAAPREVTGGNGTHPRGPEQAGPSGNGRAGAALDAPAGAHLAPDDPSMN